MENRFGNILKEFEYKWVNSVREMVRKMERELEASEDSPLRDSQSAFWVTPSSGGGSCSSRSGQWTPEENSENIPPPDSVTTPENTQKCQPPLKTLGLGLEKKRKLATVMSYLESQAKATKRLKDCQPSDKTHVYNVTPTVTSPDNNGSFNTRRVLNFGDSDDENHEEIKASTFQEPEFAEMYERRALGQLYFDPCSPEQDSSQRTSSGESGSLEAENLHDQIQRNALLFTTDENAVSRQRLQFPIRQRGRRSMMLLSDLSPISEAEVNDSSE